MNKTDRTSELNAKDILVNRCPEINKKFIYKSPALKTSACLRRKGPTASRTSSIPVLAWKVNSVALNVAIDPSAPPPLRIRD